MNVYEWNVMVTSHAIRTTTDQSDQRGIKTPTDVLILTVSDLKLTSPA